MTLSDLDKRELKRIAVALRVAFKSSYFPAAKKDALEEILFETNNDAQVHFTHYKLIEECYPLIIENLNFDFGRGIHSAISSIIDSELYGNEKFKEKVDLRVEISQKSFDQKQEEFCELAEGVHLGAIVAGLLKNDCLPQIVKDKIKMSFDDIYTQLGDTTAQAELDNLCEYSPEYNAALFEKYFDKTEGAETGEKESGE